MHGRLFCLAVEHNWLRRDKKGCRTRIKVSNTSKEELCFNVNQAFLRHDDRFGVNNTCALVAAEDVAGVYFCFHVVEGGVVAVGDYGVAAVFELCEVVHHFAAEEGAAVFEGGLVDDDFGTFGFDAFHYALYARLAEVVAVRLHGQPVYADDALPFFRRIEIAAIVIIVVACHV